MALANNRNERSLSSFSALTIVGAMACAATAPTGALAAGPMVDPTNEVMCLLYYQLAKTPAPLDDYAGKNRAVVDANEFDKPAAVAKEKDRLTALVASLQGVTAVRINVNNQFGEYDSTLGGFPLNFSPDQFLYFNCSDGTQARLRFANAQQAQAWVLDPKTAQADLKKNLNGRDVLTTVDIDLTGVDDTAPGDPLMMVGNITSVAVQGAYNHTPLGQYTVKAQ